jgi:hypothetical protein
MDAVTEKAKQSINQINEEATKANGTVQACSENATIANDLII